MAVAGRERPPQLGFADALELTVLVARKAPAGTRGSLRAGSCATSRRILTRRSTKPCWPRHARGMIWCFLKEPQLGAGAGAGVRPPL